MEILGYSNKINNAVRYISKDLSKLFVGGRQKYKVTNMEDYVEIKENYDLLVFIDFKVISDLRSCSSGVELDIEDISNNNIYRLKTKTVNELLRMLIVKDIEPNEELIMRAVFTVKVRGLEHILEIVPAHKIRVSRRFQK